MNFQRRHVDRIDFSSFFRRVRYGKSLVRYLKGAVIYAQGDVSDAVFFLQSGQVNLTVYSPRGKQAIIGILRAGDFLGEDCLVGQATRVVTAVAAIDSVAVRVEKAAMRGLLRAEPKLSEVFLSFLITRKIGLEEDLVDQLFNSAAKRLVRALLLLARAGKRQGSRAVIPRITHETLAEMIGATRAQVSTLMNRFRKEGLIDYDGDIRVNESLIDFVFEE